MLERMEELEDIVVFDRAMESREEGFPAANAKRLIAEKIQFLFSANIGG